MLAAGPDIATFIDWEAVLLDQHRLYEWLELLTEDAWYWIPLAPDQQSPLDGPSHIYDTREVLLARVYRLKDAQNLTQRPPSRCCRVMGRPFIITADTPAARAEIVVRSSFQLIESLPHRDSDDCLRHFAGSVTYGLVRKERGLRIQWRRVDLVNSERALHGVSILI